MITRYIPSYSLKDLFLLFFSGLRRKHAQNDNLIYQMLPFDTATDALIVALTALNIRGKVAIPAYTCAKIPEALLVAGCCPIFIDISPGRATMPASALKNFQAGDLAAVLATHMHGIPCDIYEIKEECSRLGAVLIEDCALAFGSKYQGINVGTAGSISIFSFGRGKTINLGSGGALIVNKPEFIPIINEFIQAHVCENFANTFIPNLINFLKSIIFSSDIWNLTFHLACLLKKHYHRTWFWENLVSRPKLNKNKLILHFNFFFEILKIIPLDAEFNYKNNLTSVYRSNIKECNNISHLFDEAILSEIVCPSYPLQVKGRDQLFYYLRKHGIDCGLSFSYCAAKLYLQDEFPSADCLSKEIITLPVHKGISTAMAFHIADIVNEWGTRHT